MFRLIAAKPLGRYRVWSQYEDGTTGEVDLSHLAGRGVFQEWDQPGAFEKLSVGCSGNLRWGDDLDLCPDALYLTLTGKRVEELFPSVGKGKSDA